MRKLTILPYFTFSDQAKKKEKKYTVRKQSDIMMKGLNLRYEAIAKIDPENNTLET